MHDLLLVLGLLGHSGWLRGQEDELPSCFDTGTDFLPAECSDGTAAAVANCFSELGAESGWVPAAAAVVGSPNVLAAAEVPCSECQIQS